MFVGRGPTLVAHATPAVELLLRAAGIHLPHQRITDLSVLHLLCGALAIGQPAQPAPQQAASAPRQRATALYLLDARLAQASIPDLLAVIIPRWVKATQAGGPLATERSQPRASRPYFPGSWAMAEKEQSVAPGISPSAAGRPRHDTLHRAEGCICRCWRGAGGGVQPRLPDPAPLPPTSAIFRAFVRPIALVLDFQRLRDAEHRPKLVAESERLSKPSLLHSHEIRTNCRDTVPPATSRRLGQQGRGV